MKLLKENKTDTAILLLFAVWGIYEIFAMPFVYDKFVSIAVCMVLVWLFPICCRTTKPKDSGIRYKAMQYALTFTLTLPCALKITEVLRGHALLVDSIKIVFVSIFVQSACFLFFKYKQTKDRKSVV